MPGHSAREEAHRQMAQPPKLTAEQRKAALEKAARARRVRAEVKELLKTGSLTLPQLFERADRDELVAGLKVESLIAAMPGTGKIKAKRMMETLGIAENRRIRGLGDRQKEALIEEYS
jgi:hypothetical protein